MSTLPASSLEWYADVPRSIRKQSLFGLFLVFVVCGGFAAWGMLAPLASAVIAPGSFVALGQNKVVQHFEGGIIKALLVQEGDQVVAGQDLLDLDETAAQTTVRQLLLRRLRLEATAARLAAEARGDDSYTPPDDLLQRLADPEALAINESQVESFESAQAKLSNDLEVFEESISALGFQRAGIELQIAAVHQQRDLLADELKAKATLLKKGLVTQPMVDALARELAEADGTLAKLNADLHIAAAQIARYRKQMIQVEAAAKDAALDEAQKVDADLDAVREQILEAQNILSRTSVRAPVSGTIVRLFYHTAGGVIQSGKAIAEILPSDVPLLIEARIARMQIDEVKVGQPATVRLTALNKRVTPMLDGTVVYVSADAISDGNSLPGHETYIARVNIDPGQFARVEHFVPTPGMTSPNGSIARTWITSAVRPTTR